MNVLILIIFVAISRSVTIAVNADVSGLITIATSITGNICVIIIYGLNSEKTGVLFAVQKRILRFSTSSRDAGAD